MSNVTSPQFDAHNGRFAGSQVQEASEMTRANWEAGQALPIMMLLGLGGVCAVVSQVGLGDGRGSPLGLLGFGVCALLALSRLKAPH
jgi:hypothetical protein